MNYTNWLLVPLLASAIGLMGCSKSVSGSYVLQSPRNAGLLQLTETPDKRLIGTVQTVSIRADGTLFQHTSNLAGAVDGDTLTITVENGSFGDEKRNLSGKISGSTIDLVIPARENQPTRHSVFEKGDVALFEAASAKLSAESKAILDRQLALKLKAEAEQRDLLQRAAAERARTQSIAEMDAAATKLAADLKDLSDKQVNVTERANAIGKQYADTVKKAQKFLQRERQLVGLGTSQSISDAKSVNRDLRYLLDDVRDMDKNVRDSNERWEKLFAGMDSRIIETQRYCHPPSNKEPEPLVAHPGPCRALSEAVAAYRDTWPKLRAAINIPIEAMTRSAAEFTAIRNEANAPLK